jgi:hypothetical protein
LIEIKNLAWFRQAAGGLDDQPPGARDVLAGGVSWPIVKRIT